MASIDFPSSPTTGQSVTVGGVTWTFDGVKWTTSGSAGPALPVAMNDNRIINGDMRIDQRNNGANGTANGYTVDRWQYNATQATKGTWQRIGPAGPVVAALGWGYWFSFTSSSAYVSIATDTFAIYQPIEADMVSDFAWGTANAQSVTLSFWTSSSLTGTFSGAIRNQPAPATRSYPFSFSIPTANTWTKIAIIIPGDTAGTWVMAGNAAGLQVMFDLGSGANLRASAGAWASGNYWGATGAQSVVAVNGATFLLTGVKLEIGSVATPYNRQSLAKSMADCQRYFSTGTIRVVGYAGGANVIVGYAQSLPVTMRTSTPTITPTWTTQTNGAGTVVSLDGSAFEPFITATAAGQVNLQGTFTASAEL